MQNILLGKQTMSVYKPIQAEAASPRRSRSRSGPARTPTAHRRPSSTSTIIGIDAADGEATDSADGEGVVPYFAPVPIGVTADNMADTVIADGFRTIEEICAGDVAETDFCQENASRATDVSRSTGGRARRLRGRRVRRAHDEVRHRLVADTPLLECKGVSKAFGAVQALYQVDFEVRRARSWPSSATTAPASPR